MSSNIILGPIGHSSCPHTKSKNNDEDESVGLEQVTIGNEVEKRPFVDKLVISSKSPWKSYFDISILLLVGYSCQSTLLYVAFGQPTNPFHLGIDFAVEILFYIDFIFNFFQEFIDKDS